MVSHNEGYLAQVHGHSSNNGQRNVNCANLRLPQNDYVNTNNNIIPNHHGQYYQHDHKHQLIQPPTYNRRQQNYFQQQPFYQGQHKYDIEPPIFIPSNQIYPSVKPNYLKQNKYYGHILTENIHPTCPPNPYYSVTNNYDQQQQQAQQPPENICSNQYHQIPKYPQHYNNYNHLYQLPPIVNTSYKQPSYSNNPPPYNPSHKSYLIPSAPTQDQIFVIIIII